MTDAPAASQEHADDFGALLARLLSPDGGPVVRVDAHEWALVEYRPTGRLYTRTVRVGDGIYTADVPEKAPHRLGAAATLAELAAAYGRDDSPADKDWSTYLQEHAERHAGFTARDTDVTATLIDAVTRRVLDAANAADPLQTGQRRACRNCRGQGGGDHAGCGCKDRGLHYLGVIADADAVIVDEPHVPDNLAPHDQGFDPDCADCGGTGNTRWTCPVCDGTGREPVCVDWLIAGPDGNVTVRRDVAALLRDGDARLHVAVHSTNRRIQVVVRTDSRPLASRVDRQVAAGQPTWVRRGDFFHDWSFDVSFTFELELTPADATGDDGSDPRRGLTVHDGPFVYSPVVRDLRTGDVTISPAVPLDRLADVLPTGEEIVNGLQQQASGNPWMGLEEVAADSATRGADGLIERVEQHAVVRLPRRVLFDALVAQATDAGYAIGLTYGFIATGQYGPAVYLLGDGDRAVTQLGDHYEWRTAVAEAHARLPRVLARLDGRSGEQS